HGGGGGRGRWGGRWGRDRVGGTGTNRDRRHRRLGLDRYSWRRRHRSLGGRGDRGSLFALRRAASEEGQHQRARDDAVELTVAEHRPYPVANGAADSVEAVVVPEAPEASSRSAGVPGSAPRGARP